MMCASEHVESVSVYILDQMSHPTLDRAALACAVYAVTQEVLRSIFVPLYPEDCGGTPCWRSVIVLFVQLFWMPVAFFLALRNQAWSMRQWSADCAKHGLQPAAQSIVYIFYVYLLLDILYQELFKPLVILRRLMVIHHVVCLLGNFYGTKLSPLAAVPPCGRAAAGSRALPVRARGADAAETARARASDRAASAVGHVRVLCTCTQRSSVRSTRSYR